jgi:hypothetical protein
VRSPEAHREHVQRRSAQGRWSTPALRRFPGPEAYSPRLT